MPEAPDARHYTSIIGVTHEGERRQRRPLEHGRRSQDHDGDP